MFIHIKPGIQETGVEKQNPEARIQNPEENFLFFSF
jgi:hypothetical protein